MKVLFIATGNSKNFDISPFIAAQRKSLIDLGAEVDFFPVIGKGFMGYLQSAFKLRTYLKKNKYDLIHAHFTLCGWAAVLSGTRIPIVLSVMGSDAYGDYTNPKRPQFFSRYLTLLTYLIQPFLKGIISKSANIDRYIYRRKIANIIPNGINLSQFQYFEHDFREELGLSKDKKYVLFLGIKSFKRKNFALVEKAVKVINDPDLEILAMYPITHDEVVKYLWSADMFVSAAFMEGSPNAIKEAMACNCPIVTTNVGDVEWVMGNTEGCYLAGFKTVDYAEKIVRALHFAETKKRTEGRKRILELGLDSEMVAKKIIRVYEKVLEAKR